MRYLQIENARLIDPANNLDTCLLYTSDAADE